MAKSKRDATPILFEAALPQRTAFTLDGEGEATLKPVVPEQFAKVLSDNIHRLRNLFLCSAYRRSCVTSEEFEHAS